MILRPCLEQLEISKIIKNHRFLILSERSYGGEELKKVIKKTVKFVVCFTTSFGT